MRPFILTMVLFLALDLFAAYVIASHLGDLVVAPLETVRGALNGR
jgi:hypothetical protein